MYATIMSHRCKYTPSLLFTSPPNSNRLATVSLTVTMSVVCLPAHYLCVSLCALISDIIFVCTLDTGRRLVAHALDLESKYQISTEKRVALVWRTRAHFYCSDVTRRAYSVPGNCTEHLELGYDTELKLEHAYHHGTWITMRAWLTRHTTFYFGYFEREPLL